MLKVKRLASDDDEAFNPRQITRKKSAKKIKRKILIPMLPEEIWALIISFVSNYKILQSLLKTSSTLQRIALDPKSPAWTNSLKAFLKSRRKTIDEYTKGLKVRDDMAMLVMLTTFYCSACNVKQTTIGYLRGWPFKKRFCCLCLNENTIVGTALEYAFPGCNLYKALPSVRLIKLEDLNHMRLHQKEDKHYLIEDLVKIYGNAITDGYVFEEFGGVSGKDYMNRKFKALEAMKVKTRFKMAKGEEFEEDREEDEDNVEESVIESESEDEVLTVKARAKFQEL